MGETVVFLHGIGVGPESWDEQKAGLPDGFTGFAPQVAGLATNGPPFTLARAAADLIVELDRREIDRAHVCGLSLGAMIATQIVLDHPERVASLVLSGGQVRPPRAAIAVQSLLWRILPQRFVAPDGTSTTQLRAVLREVAHADFRDRLGAIRAPTLVLCGSRDVANRPGARALAAGIPGARLRIVRGGGHELNTQMPGAFRAELAAFLTGT